MTGVALCLATACDDYDDSALWEAVNGLEERVAALEQWQKETNNNIAALQELLTTNDMITSVTPVLMSGDTVGYTISFLNSDPITLYNGEKGEAGDTPQIGLTQDDAGDWYWMLNGELMTDTNGDPIRANGEDGKDGQDGSDGDDGATGPAGPQGKPGDNAPTPQIKLGKDVTGTIADGGSAVEDAWYLSVDNGKTWYRVSGQDGTSGGSFFEGVTIEGDYVIFTLSDGGSFKVPCGGCTIDEQGDYTVYSAAGLQAWVTAAQSTPSTCCTLAADIDMSGQTWTPVGNSLGNPYTGTFDGAGYSISNLSSNTVGLFNYVSSGTIKNLIMETPQINTGNGGNNIGIIVGRLEGGTVENCHVVGGSIRKNVSVGSVVGSVSNGTVRACSSSATVYASLVNGGGIVGYNNGTVIACYAIGQVTGGQRIGAVIGENNNTITACYWSGTSTYGWYNFTAWNSSYTPVSANKVDDTNITWATAAEEMNKQLTDYQWVVNTDDATKATRPLLITRQGE